MNVVFVTRDLMLGSRVQGAARSLEVDLKVSAGLPAADSLQEAPPDRILIDLQSVDDGLKDWVESILDLHPNCQLVAYAPHVQTQRLDMAREAGIATVLTRGQFDRSMNDLLR